MTSELYMTGEVEYLVGNAMRALPVRRTQTGLGVLPTMPRLIRRGRIPSKRIYRAEPTTERRGVSDHGQAGMETVA